MKSSIMKFRRWTVFIFMLSYCFEVSAEEESDAYKKVCKEPKVTLSPISGFLTDWEGKEWNIPLHMKAPQFAENIPTSSKDLSKEPSKDTKSSGPSELEICVHLYIKTNSVGGMVPINCTIQEKNLQCLFKREIGKAKIPDTSTFQNLDGTFFQSKTDGQTYSVMMGCLNQSRRPVWFVLSFQSAFNNSVKKQILNHVASMGFDPEQVGTHQDQYYVEKLKVVNCSESSIPIQSLPGGESVPILGRGGLI